MSVVSTSPTDVLVRIRGLRTELGGKRIFDGVDLDIPRGRVTSPAGKVPKSDRGDGLQARAMFRTRRSMPS